MSLSESMDSLFNWAKALSLIRSITSDLKVGVSGGVLPGSRGGVSSVKKQEEKAFTPAYILEGINSLIRAARAKVKGYRSPDNFIIIYIVSGKLNFNLPI